MVNRGEDWIDFIPTQIHVQSFPDRTIVSYVFEFRQDFATRTNSPPQKKRCTLRINTAGKLHPSNTSTCQIQCKKQQSRNPNRFRTVARKIDKKNRRKKVKTWSGTKWEPLNLCFAPHVSLAWWLHRYQSPFAYVYVWCDFYGIALSVFTCAHHSPHTSRGVKFWETGSKIWGEEKNGVEFPLRNATVWVGLEWKKGSKGKNTAPAKLPKPQIFAFETNYAAISRSSSVIILVQKTKLNQNYLERWEKPPVSLTYSPSLAWAKMGYSGFEKLIGCADFDWRADKGIWYIRACQKNTGRNSDRGISFAIICLFGFLSVSHHKTCPLLGSRGFEWGFICKVCSAENIN